MVPTAPQAPPRERLEAAVARHERLAIAFSGGADSALLAYVATSVLGRARVVCVTADSASLDRDELDETRALADEWGLEHLVVGTDELADPAYAANGLDRCYHCKTALMEVLGEVARDRRATVALGVNLDDLGEHRPGQQAALERGAVFPLVEAALSKSDVRALSRRIGLRTADKPAAACLASRVPHGTPVSLEVLDRVGRAERALRRLGFASLRVRHYGDCARIEVPLADLEVLLERRALVVEAVRSTGYRYVTVDLEGLRSGNLASAAIEDRDRGARR